MTTQTFPAESLEQARALVKSLENGNDADAHQLLAKLAERRESSLFKEIGKLTRELHETINNFRLDVRIAGLAEKEIPDARERLNYVITMTEQAANRTLDAMEQSLPIAARLQQRATELRVANGANDDISGRIDAFIDQVETETVVLQRNLSDALIAQDYQDLTGQIIRRVITLVHDVEQNLIGLVRLSGQRMGVVTPAIATVMHLSGPRVPSLDQDEGLSGQDDVDNLLSSLGF